MGLCCSIYIIVFCLLVGWLLLLLLLLLLFSTVIRQTMEHGTFRTGWIDPIYSPHDGGVGSTSRRWKTLLLFFQLCMYWVSEGNQRGRREFHDSWHIICIHHIMKHKHKINGWFMVKSRTSFSGTLSLSLSLSLFLTVANWIFSWSFSSTIKLIHGGSTIYNIIIIAVYILLFWTYWCRRCCPHDDGGRWSVTELWHMTRHTWLIHVLTSYFLHHHRVRK
jgi:hypothetical protein